MAGDMGNTWVMPWMTSNLIELRLEFVTLASQEGANVAELCRRYGLSRRVGYKWLERFRAAGQQREALANRSRRPKRSPRQTAGVIEQAVVELRERHPAWGPRKLKRRLEDLGAGEGLPAHSTMGAMLRRRGLVEPAEALKHQATQRFERERANELWQMDFKGDFALSRGGRCHPLPILDDHSRFLLGLVACANQQEATVRRALEGVFERYGLPEAMLCDNGGPWAGSGGEWTRLGVWLLRQGIGLVHGRPYHPQTQGKEERLNRTLKAEVLCRQDLRDLSQAQEVFEAWRSVYNCERPHEALGMAVPAQRYQASQRSYRRCLEEVEYGPADEVRKVKSKGEIMWKSRRYFVGTAFAGQPVGLRATKEEHLVEVYYAHQRLGRIDLREVAPGKDQCVSIREPRKARAAKPS